MTDRAKTDPLLNDPMLKPRYTGVPTFMRAPLVEDPARLDIAMIGPSEDLFDDGLRLSTGGQHVRAAQDGVDHRLLARAEAVEAEHVSENPVFRRIRID